VVAVRCPPKLGQVFKNDFSILNYRQRLNRNKISAMDKNSIYHPSKLIRIERYISYYHITGDDEKMIAEIDINIIPLESLLTIVTAKDDDPHLYSIYHLNQTQLDQINNLLPKKIVFDFSKYEYHLECGGIYEYMLKSNP
jgi:hypothetical protein